MQTVCTQRADAVPRVSEPYHRNPNGAPRRLPPDCDLDTAATAHQRRSILGEQARQRGWRKVARRASPAHRGTDDSEGRRRVVAGGADMLLRLLGAGSALSSAARPSSAGGLVMHAELVAGPNPRRSLDSKLKVSRDRLPTLIACWTTPPEPAKSACQRALLPRAALCRWRLPDRLISS